MVDASWEISEPISLRESPWEAGPASGSTGSTVIGGWKYVLLSTRSCAPWTFLVDLGGLDGWSPGGEQLYLNMLVGIGTRLWRNQPSHPHWQRPRRSRLGCVLRTDLRGCSRWIHGVQVGAGRSAAVHQVLGEYCKQILHDGPKKMMEKPWKATIMVVLNSEFLPLLGFPSGEMETGMIGGTAGYKVQKEVTMCFSLRVACLGFYNCLISVSSRFLGRWRCRVSCDMIMICLNHSRKIYRHMCALWSYEHIYSTVHNYEPVISYLMPHQAFEVPIEMYYRLHSPPLGPINHLKRQNPSMSLDVASYIIGNGKIYAQKFCDDKGCDFPKKTGCGVVFQKRKWWYGPVSVAFLETDSFHPKFTCWSPFLGND